MANIQKNSEKITPFGGIFPIMECFDRLLGQTIVHRDRSHDPHVLSGTICSPISLRPHSGNNYKDNRAKQRNNRY